MKCNECCNQLERKTMSNLVRVQVVFDLSNPTDAAIFAEIEPLMRRHRASQFIRDALARALGFCGETVTRLVMPTPIIGFKANRPAPDDTLVYDNRASAVSAEDALESASDAFLTMFG
jgi:hypothetical protein